MQATRIEIIRAVKHLRVWLVLLLAVLLPLRAAMAAAILCPAAGVGAQGESITHGASHDSGVLHHGDGAHHHHHGAFHAYSPDGNGAGTVDDGQSPGVQDSCNVCSAFCSATPLVGSGPDLAGPRDLADMSFPDLRAPAATFLSGGQERPPRSI